MDWREVQCQISKQIPQEGEKPGPKKNEVIVQTPLLLDARVDTVRCADRWTITPWRMKHKLHHEIHRILVGLALVVALAARGQERATPTTARETSAPDVRTTAGEDDQPRLPGTPAPDFSKRPPSMTAMPLTPGPDVQASVTPIPALPPIASPAVQQLVTLAQDDLARKLGTDRSRIVLVEYRNVVWPDKGRGCPVPGMEYPQVRMDGYLIRLRFGNEIYEYHGGGDREAFLCKQAPSKP